LNFVCGTENRLLIKLLYCIKLIAHVDQIMVVLWFVPPPALEFRVQHLHSVILFRFGCMLSHAPFDEGNIEFTQPHSLAGKHDVHMTVVVNIFKLSSSAE